MFLLSVVSICHFSSIVMGNLMFKAQDMNMTNGEYVFWTIVDAPTAATSKPWLGYNMTGQDVNYRMKGLYSRKLVDCVRLHS
jgi:hypothetical protein